MHTNNMGLPSNSEDDLVEEILQEAWTKLLTARQAGKLPNFDTEVPAQIQSWLCDIYDTQLTTLRLTDPEAWRLKMFSIAMAFRISLRVTIGVDYFMEQMNNAAKMAALDKLIEDLDKVIDKDNMVRRAFR